MSKQDNLSDNSKSLLCDQNFSSDPTDCETSNTSDFVKTDETNDSSPNKVEDSDTLSSGEANVKSGENSNLQSLCSDMFNKMSQYLQGEIGVTVEDYALLEKMNLATKEKYDLMQQTARNVGDNLHTLNSNISDLQPYLDQIEQIESSVIALEQAAYKLDTYSRQLEDRFKRIQRK